MQIFSHTLSLALTKLRMNAPLVQCICDPVALDFLYNVLLSLGVKPEITYASEEIADFSNLSQCLMISAGAFSGQGASAMIEAANLARGKKIPWVLEPRGVGKTQFRDKTIYELFSFEPNVVRTNFQDVMQMARHWGYEGKAIEKARSIEEQLEAARFLSGQTKAVIVMTGATDLITDNTHTLRIMNGNALMTKTAGMGSALSATIAAFLSVEQEPLVAAATGVGIFDIIGELAGAEAEAPAAFRSAFIDKLFSADANSAMRRLKVL
jgi:hydroxyethylthiazole kinase